MGLWDLVENGFTEPESTENLTENQKKKLEEVRQKDANALSIIQRGVTKSIFPRIIRATKVKKAWDILKVEYHGDDKQASVEEEKEDEGNLFYACQSVMEHKRDEWFLDSGCSNHMAGNGSLFLDMDSTFKSQVKLRNGALVEAKGKGKGTIGVQTKNGGRGNGCKIYDNGQPRQLVKRIRMESNRSFTFTLKYVKDVTMKAHICELRETLERKTMASNGNVMSATQPLIPIFKGEGYEFWSIRMRTLLKSQDLWDLVEQGYPDPDEESRLKENKKKDSKALVIIQQAVHDSVFSRIAAATTSKQAWSILRKEFQGDSKVIVVRLQSLRRDFETLYMKSGESIADFLSRAMAIVSQMRSYGEKISDETVVAKVLRSLTPKFDHVVAAIEESKDLSFFSFDELMGSLQAHESRINRSLEKNEEKAFQVKETVTRTAEAQSATFRGRGRGGFRGRGRGRGYGRGRG
ncbi:hypothetical protein RJ640_029403 [Escallonia rubra]|uniref:Retrovirus-related Pol polyprotein from transposon TNT 1-94-like beta-barrel domain-containing protein n=1 Tax=Escallonia rubra TaxID=112253 RepID=A0AA88UAM7_9ASTE|nr:hypothetical protein RJ640_029403 [Escallonia rubra]